MTSYLVPALLISMVVGTMAGIDCYRCNGGACNDPFFLFGPGVSNTCPTNFLGVNLNNFCQKDVDSSGSVTRSCATLCIEGCFLGSCTYCCNSNRCNGGTTVATSFVAMGVALVAAFIFSRQ